MTTLGGYSLSLSLVIGFCGEVHDQFSCIYVSKMTGSRASRLDIACENSEVVNRISRSYSSIRGLNVKPARTPPSDFDYKTTTRCQCNMDFFIFKR